MIRAFLPAVFGCMVTRVVELKTQIMLSTRFTERFRGKITDPPMAPTSFFGIPEAAGPAETENYKINLSPCLCHQLLTPFGSRKGPKKPFQSNLTSPRKPFGTSSHKDIEVRILCLKGVTAGKSTPFPETSGWKDQALRYTVKPSSSLDNRRTSREVAVQAPLRTSRLLLGEPILMQMRKVAVYVTWDRGSQAQARALRRKL